jgi:uncharacterized protein (DUF1015 family)
MVDIAPFRAIRYREDKIGDLSQVIAPPYDVISPEQQDELYARHQNNIIRIDLNKKEPGDGELSGYDRSARLLDDWLKNGIMFLDDQPAYYVLAQTFKGPDGVERTRTGFFGRARLTPFGEGPIMPHERTLKGPKLDRLRLYRTTRTNLSPIFGMYQDPDHQVLNALEAAKKGVTPSIATMSGVKNQLWRITDGAAIQKIEDALRPKRLYIADGHHRYETGIAYRDERRQTSTNPGISPGYESILMFSAAVEDPGMVVFPTHRLVHALPGFEAAEMTGKIERFFSVTSAPSTTEAAIKALAEAGRDSNAFLMVTKQGAWVLSLKKGAPLSEVDALPKHPATRGLDVTVLHAIILEHVLGISREAQATQANLRYSKDNKEAFESPKTMPEVQVAFLMNPTKVGEVIEVADANEIMPQKSTFFYPKIPSGLVLYPLD